MLRVVSAARRRRNRRLAIVAVVALATVLAIALPLAMASEDKPAPIASSAPVAGLVVKDGTRAEIYAAARARYASVLDSSRVGRAHLEFGRLTVTGARAKLRVDLVCVPICGRGEELTLVKQGGSWQVVAARTTWVS